MYGRSWRSLTSSLGQADRGGQIKRKAKKFLCSRLPPRNDAFSPNHVYVQICQKNPVIWSFGLLYFTCLPSPSLLPCFTSGHKEELILYKRTLLNKTVRLGRGFVQREWYNRDYFHACEFVLKGWYLSRAGAYPTASLIKICSTSACCQQGSGVPVESPQNQSLTIWSQREESIIWISLTGKRKVGNIHRHF